MLGKLSLDNIYDLADALDSMLDWEEDSPMDVRIDG